MLGVIGENKFPIKLWANDIEEEARKQLNDLANMPFIFKWLAVMPDCHAGKGSTVGTVIATKGAVIPAAIGVDIGCSMTAIKLNFSIDEILNIVSKRKETLEDLRLRIE